MASNSDEDLIKITNDAFEIYSGDNDTYIEAVKALTKLKGIGPATASLILSCYDPEKVPFFSDELFRYSLWKRADGQGWDRSIKYNLREYKQLVERVREIRERLQEEHGRSVGALDLEKVAYVLAKDAQPDSKRHAVVDGEEADKEVEQPSKVSKKRKSNLTGHDEAEDSESPKPKTKRPKKHLVGDFDKKGCTCLRKGEWLCR